MLDKLLTDEKTFRILCLILFAIIFFVILSKNKKEKFSQLSTENLQAIKNLGDFASNLQSGGTSGEYVFPGTTLIVDAIKIGDQTVNEAYLKDKISSTYTGDLTLNGNLNLNNGKLTINNPTNNEYIIFKKNSAVKGSIIGTNSQVCFGQSCTPIYSIGFS